MEVNKVLKMNQDKSLELLNNSQSSSLRMDADNNIQVSMELLRSLGKEKELDRLSVDIEREKEKRKLDNRPKVELWDELVTQANDYLTNPIELEDIMTDEEIQSAFQELEGINKKFSEKTSIVNKADLSFLAIATALQVVKTMIFPYVAEKVGYGEKFDKDDRLCHNDKSIKKAHREANDKYRDKNLKKHETGYWINILYQTPPYDITAGSPDIGINMHGKAHRMYTLGHDPILGWIFGTANILSDCITFNTFQTNRVIRVDPITKKRKMKITPQIVPIGVMFKECNEIINDDYLNLPAAIFAQARHYKSDEFTKMGLPVPFLSSINEDFASKLYKEQYDALCFARDAKIVGASFFITKLLDIILTLTHGLFRKEDEDKDLYEVRTRKILLISNTIASTSSIIKTGITSNPQNLDIGSLLSTITHFFTDIRFITKIKQEFIESEISNRIQKEVDEIDELYKCI